MLEMLQGNLDSKRIYSWIFMPTSDFLLGSKDSNWINEAQCEVLWRMGQWQDAAEAPTQHSEGSNCFNATLCLCLKARLYSPSFMHKL